MPAVWFSLKKSFHCKSEPSEVYDPKIGDGNRTNIFTKKIGRSGCSRSISNLKDVIHGSKRHTIDNKPPICSPRSIGSSELVNPITHEVVFSNSTCEVKITSFHHMVPHYNPRTKAVPPRRNHGGSKVLGGRNGGNIALSPKPFTVTDYSHGGSILTCHKCGEKFKRLEAVEGHHLSMHAVTELVEGDSSRKIVETICRTSWLKAENNWWRIERVLRVHNMQKTLARFEDYREMLKIKASKLPKKHPRCLADGNELLRFYGATLACSLGMNGSSSLCVSEKCSICQILRYGFSTKKECNGGGVGVFTTSTSGRAIESIELNGQNLKKALIVCRVIAGRVHRPLENSEELVGRSGFDSLAGQMSVSSSNIEDLYLLSPRALLPCFVVICRP